MKLVAILSCAFALSSCASAAHYSIPADMTNEDLQRTLAGCHAQSVTIDLFVRRRFIDYCMRARGFVRQD